MKVVSTYSYLGLPEKVAVTIFTVCLIAALTPFASGTDLGVFKIPSLPDPIKRRLRIWGPVMLMVAVICFLPLWGERMPPVAQQTRWGPVDGLAPGIYIIGEPPKAVIPWKSLKDEIENRILPQVDQIPSDSKIELRDFHGKRNWIIAVVNPDSHDVANIWFGPDPLNHWAYDGLVRVGRPDTDDGENKAIVWHTFQRYSDGSYQRR